LPTLYQYLASLRHNSIKKKSGARVNSSLWNRCTVRQVSKEKVMGLILIIALIVLILGASPNWGYSREWGYTPSGGLTIALVIVLVLIYNGTITRGF